MWMFSSKKIRLPDPRETLQGRDVALPVPEYHFVNGNRMTQPFPDNVEMALLGMGCFWGVERIFWQIPGVFSTAVGYAGGHTPNPNYEEVCSGMTGHNEVARIIFDPKKINYEKIVKLFWENHDPTQGMRQGNDVGTQYRSGIYYYSNAQKDQALALKDIYQQALSGAGYGLITTEIIPAPDFYFAEDYHQQYLAKVPNGYCGMGGTGIDCPAGEIATI